MDQSIFRTPLLLVSIIFVYSASSTIKLPKGFIQCKRNDVAFEKCSTDALNKAINPLTRGVPKLGLPPIDPLRISTLYVDQGTGPVTIKLNFTDLDIKGLGNCKMSDLKVDLNQRVISLKMRSSKPIILEGTYKIAGKVLILPIVGSGKSIFVLSGFNATGYSISDGYTKDGEEFWKIQNVDFTFDVTKLHMRLDNLFNGDKRLGDNMNVFLNENWSDILKELKPAFRSAFAEALKEIIQRFFHKVPIAQIYPKI